MKYKNVTYAKGYTLKVDPPDRGPDVLHYTMFGTLLGGRSLEGVTWVETALEDDPIMSKRAKSLAKAAKQSN